MVLVHKLNPVVRATLVISAVAVLVTGVTFALSSQATLADNSFSVASADLVLDVDSDADTTYDDSEPGFDFDNLVPGTPSDTYGISLRNDGDGLLDVRVHLPSSVTVPSELDASKVRVKFDHVGGTVGTDKEFTLAELINPADVPEVLVEDLPATETVDYDITVLVQNDAISGEGGVGINNFDIIFTGLTPTP